jgi:hypothetical protein
LERRPQPECSRTAEELTGGRQFLAHGAGVAVVSDVIQVTLFAAYLVATRGRVRATA